MSDPALPNLLVIGAAKCGTSSLHYYLGLHPQAQMSQPKELSFFIDPEGFDPSPYMSTPRDRHLLPAPPNWSLGTDWYAAHFSAAARVRGESTVAYSFPWYADVPERIASVVPEARIIYMVREPIGRIVSHHHQYVVGRREWRPLGEALADPRNAYVGATRYGTVLKRFLTRFPRERVLVLRQEDLLARRHETLREVFAFLGLDEFRSPEFERLRNRSAAKGRQYRLAERLRRSRAAAPLRRAPAGVRARLESALASRGGHGVPPGQSLAPALRQRALEALEPEIAELEQLTGWDLGAWKA